MTAAEASQTERAVTHLAFSGRTLGGEPELLRALLRVKRAAARANAAAGDVPADVTAAIVAAIDAILAAPAPGEFPIDPYSGGGGLAQNVNVNEAIAARATRAGVAVHPKAHVNASQSSADVSHTAFRLAILDRHGPLGAALAGLVESLAGRARAFAGIPILTRTCLRDALPGRLGDLLAGHAALVKRRAAALEAAVSALLHVNLGGTVVGSGEGASDAYRAAVIPALCEETGRPLVPRASLLDAAQNADDLAAVSSALAQLAGALMKVAQDVRLLSSGPETGFGELRLPAVMQGSSFFRDKVNPLVPESLLHACFLVQGLDHAAQAACARGELQLHGFETVPALAILDAQRLLAAAVERFDRSCVCGLEGDEARARAHAERAHPR